MFNDYTNGLLDTLRQHATKHNLEDNLNNLLDSRLSRHAEKGYQVNLYRDFAPLSLYFTIEKDGKIQLNGGIIYHGTHDNGGDGSAPTFAVCLTPVTGWAIHT
jgi:hypothetical protein